MNEEMKALKLKVKGLCGSEIRVSVLSNEIYLEGYVTKLNSRGFFLETIGTNFILYNDVETIREVE